MSARGLIHFQVFVPLGGGQRLLLKEPVNGGAHGRNRSHSDSLHGDVFGLWLPGSRLGAEREANKRRPRWIEIALNHRFSTNGDLLRFPGRPECHAPDLHHPIGVLPQTLARPMVSGWKPGRLRFGADWLLCHDHGFDHDGPLPSGLFTRGGDVLLRGCKRLCHYTPGMKWMFTKFGLKKHYWWIILFPSSYKSLIYILSMFLYNFVRIWGGKYNF